MTKAWLVGFIALAVTVGCNDKEDRKKSGNGNGRSGAEVETKQEVEKTMLEDCEAKSEVASLDQRTQVNTTLARYSAFSDPSISCSESSDDYNAIVRFELDTQRRQSTQLDRIANAGSSLQAVKDAANAIKTNMLNTRNFDCNLVVIQQIANGLQQKLETSSKATCSAYKAEFEKAEAVIAIVDSVYSISSQASGLAMNRSQRDWNYMAETHGLASEALSSSLDRLNQIQGQLNTQARCESDSGSPLECDDEEAQAMSLRIQAFVTSTNSAMSSFIYQIDGPSDEQVGPKSDAIIGLVAEAEGLLITAKEILK